MLLYLLFIPLVAWGQTRIYLNNGDQTLSSGTYIISNYTGKNRIIITENATVTITLENVNITTTTEQGDVSPFDASKASSVTLLLKGSNSLTAVQQAPGLHAPEGEGRSITIKDGGAGSLTAQGAESWPGIGVLFNTASNITIDITQKYWEKYDLGIPVNAYVGKNFVAKDCLVENFGNLAF